MEENNLLNILDEVRIFLINDEDDLYIQGTSDEACERIYKLYEKICHILVNHGKYKFDDLFWTKEKLDEARVCAEEMAKFLDE